MNETAVTAQADAMDQFQAELQRPDPDPETLATLAPTGWAPSDPIIAGRLVRAALRQRTTVEKLKAAMDEDVRAWGLMIAAQEAREQALRRFLEAYLIATGDKIKTPWGSAFLSKRPVKLEYDEAAVLDALDSLAANGTNVAACIKTKRSIVAKEFRVLFDSYPSWFRDLVKEVGGEPSVTIRKG
jgi:hypothetical protein